MFDGVIRPLRKEDVQAVKAIFNLHWKGDFVDHLSDKLDKYLVGDPVLKEQKFKFFVAEENGEVVGVSALRAAPEHMKQFASTANPAELYVAAVKEKGRGIGSALKEERFKEAKREGYTEVVLFSAVDHKDAWKFHDKNFERVGPAVAPNGDDGFAWHKILD